MKSARLSTTIYLLFICISISSNVSGQNINTISTQIFLQKFDSIQNSEYLLLLNSIQENDIETVKKMVSIKSFENIKTNFMFEIGDVDLLKEKLESSWPNNSLKYFSDEEGMVYFSKKAQSSNTTQKRFTESKRGYNLEELKQTFDSFGETDKSIINIYGTETYCFHTKFLTIQLVGNTAQIIITGFNIRFFNQDAFSPLIYSNIIHRDVIFLLFLESGISLTSDYKKTIFNILEEDSIQFFEKIFPYIEKPQSITYDGMNMLHYSVQQNRPEFFDFLMQQDFKHTTPTTQGIYPIHLASEKSAGITIKILKLFPSQIELTDNDGRVALHHAVSSGNSKTMKEILLLNPNIDARDNNGATPLMLACANQNVNFHDLLLHGADFNLIDYSNNNQINYAINNTNIDGLVYLLRNKKYNFNTQSFSDLRKYSKNNYACTSVLTLTRRFHTEFKFQLNSTIIDYEGAKARVSGGYGVEFSYRILTWVDLCYTFNRLYVESGISETNELSSLQLSEDHFSSYETNYFEHIPSLKFYPVHHLNKNTPFLRLGYNFRKVQKAGLLADMTIVDDLTHISNDPFKGIGAGIGYLFRGRGRGSLELYYTHGITDVNTVYTGSYNTWSFVLGFGF